jgi:hypothetical protein
MASKQISEHSSFLTLLKLVVGGGVIVVRGGGVAWDTGCGQGEQGVIDRYMASLHSQQYFSGHQTHGKGDCCNRALRHTVTCTLVL